MSIYPFPAGPTAATPTSAGTPLTFLQGLAQRIFGTGPSVFSSPSAFQGPPKGAPWTGWDTLAGVGSAVGNAILSQRQQRAQMLLQAAKEAAARGDFASAQAAASELAKLGIPGYGPNAFQAQQTQYRQQQLAAAQQFVAPYITQWQNMAPQEVQRQAAQVAATMLKNGFPDDIVATVLHEAANPGKPAVPAGGELGTRTPPQPAVPTSTRYGVGPAPVSTVRDAFPQYAKPLSEIPNGALYLDLPVPTDPKGRAQMQATIIDAITNGQTQGLQRQLLQMQVAAAAHEQPQPYLLNPDGTVSPLNTNDPRVNDPKRVQWYAPTVALQHNTTVQDRQASLKQAWQVHQDNLAEQRLRASETASQREANAAAQALARDDALWQRKWAAVSVMDRQVQDLAKGLGPFGALLPDPTAIGDGDRNAAVQQAVSAGTLSDLLAKWKNSKDPKDQTAYAAVAQWQERVNQYNTAQKRTQDATQLLFERTFPQLSGPRNLPKPTPPPGPRRPSGGAADPAIVQSAKNAVSQHVPWDTFASHLRVQGIDPSPYQQYFRTSTPAPSPLGFASRPAGFLKPGEQFPPGSLTGQQIAGAVGTAARTLSRNVPRSNETDQAAEGAFGTATADTLPGLLQSWWSRVSPRERNVLVQRYRLRPAQIAALNRLLTATSP